MWAKKPMNAMILPLRQIEHKKYELQFSIYQFSRYAPISSLRIILGASYDEGRPIPIQKFIACLGITESETIAIM